LIFFIKCILYLQSSVDESRVMTYIIYTMIYTSSYLIKVSRLYYVDWLKLQLIKYSTVFKTAENDTNEYLLKWFEDG